MRFWLLARFRSRDWTTVKFLWVYIQLRILINFFRECLHHQHFYRSFRQETVKNGNHIKIPATCKPHLKALMKSCFSLEKEKRPSASTIVEYISNYPRMLTPCLDVPKPNLDDQRHLIEAETDQLEVFEQQIMENRDRSHTPAIAVDFLRTSVSSSALQNHSNHIQRQDPSSFEYLDMKLPRKPNGICLHDFHPDLTATLPNGNYNPVEPLLQSGPRQEISKSNLSLMKYVPMCGGFGKNSKRSSSPDDCTSEVWKKFNSFDWEMNLKGMWTCRKKSIFFLFCYCVTEICSSGRWIIWKLRPEHRKKGTNDFWMKENFQNFLSKKFPNFTTPQAKINWKLKLSSLLWLFDWLFVTLHNRHFGWSWTLVKIYYRGPPFRSIVTSLLSKKKNKFQSAFSTKKSR